MYFKTFRGYKFNKNIFRATLLLFISFMVLGWGLDGFPTTNYLYVHCPEGGGACDNPLYEGGVMYSSATLPNYSGQSITEMEQIPPGLTFGTKPNIIVRHAPLWLFVFILGSFTLNHLLYNRHKSIKKGIKTIKKAVKEVVEDERI